MAPVGPLAFEPGAEVMATDDGSLGTVETCRPDGMVCVVWPSGTHEWLPSTQLRVRSYPDIQGTP
jgi:hypothetical protein